MAALALCLWLAAGAGSSSGAEAPAAPIGDGSRILVGVGDRLHIHQDGRRISVRDEAARLGLGTDLIQLWLPRGWEDSWIDPKDLSQLAASGSTPVVVHWFFGDAISRERVRAELHEWHRSLGRMARRIAIESPVLVLLEPEFNNAPPAGETAVTDWAGFATELREAVRIVRSVAPNARVGVCAGDFSPTRNLERVLGPIAGELDFLAFQEMRAKTRRHDEAGDYLDLGAAAVSFASYLQRAFGRPLLLGYVAVSSWDGWEDSQARALDSLARRREELLRQGVFGVIYFQLRDDPQHEGYFGPAESHFGLSSAEGVAKPALEAFRALSPPPSREP